METLKYTTQIKGKNMPIPEHILEKLDADAKIEIVFRPIRRSSPDRPKMEQLIEKIEKQMDEEFPNLKGTIEEELASLAGISHDIKEDMRKYTDKEIVAMARMEKLSADYAD